MKSTITRVYRATPQTYRVVFSCGHRRTVRRSEFDQEQWFIGKPVDCMFCLFQKKDLESAINWP